MVYNGINFNEAHWKKKTEAEFVAHEKHHGLSEDQLKEVHALMNAKSGKKEKEAKPAETISNKKA